MYDFPNPNEVFPNEYKTSCFIKNVITAPNIIVGDYTYYDDPDDPAGFERNNVLFNWPEFGDRLVLPDRERREVRHGAGKSPAAQRDDLPVPCVRRRMGA